MANTNALTQREATQAAVAHRAGQLNYRYHLRLMFLIVALALIAGAGMVLWLIRSVLPLTLAYAQFASQVADGDVTGTLEVRGDDNIGDLGRTLQHMATRRQAERSYEQTQLEFTNALQIR